MLGQRSRSFMVLLAVSLSIGALPAMSFNPQPDPPGKQMGDGSVTPVDPAGIKLHPGEAQGFNPQPDPPGIGDHKHIDTTGTGHKAHKEMGPTQGNIGDIKGLNFTNEAHKGGNPEGIKMGDIKGLNFTNEAHKGEGNPEGIKGFNFSHKGDAAIKGEDKGLNFANPADTAHKHHGQDGALKGEGNIGDIKGLNFTNEAHKGEGNPEGIKGFNFSHKEDAAIKGEDKGLNFTNESIKLHSGEESPGAGDHKHIKGGLNFSDNAHKGEGGNPVMDLDGVKHHPGEAKGLNFTNEANSAHKGEGSIKLHQGFAPGHDGDGAAKGLNFTNQGGVQGYKMMSFPGMDGALKSPSAIKMPAMMLPGAEMSIKGENSLKLDMQGHKDHKAMLGPSPHMQNSIKLDIHTAAPSIKLASPNLTPGGLGQSGGGGGAGKSIKLNAPAIKH